MKQSAIIKPAVYASSALFLGASGLFAGTPAPVVAPMPAPAPECGNPGWTLTAAALYLKSHVGLGSEFDFDEGIDGDFDWGFRGSLGYERPDGLFGRVVGFWYEGDAALEDEGYEWATITPEVYAIDFLVGDTFCPTPNTSLEVSAGIRYGHLGVDEITFDGWESDYEYDFDGWGPTFQLRARRTLTDRVALYADLQQSFLFGEREFSWGDNDDYEVDTLAAVSEIRGGIEFLWGMAAIQNAYLRLGGEGQYWWVDSFDLGLVGVNAEVGFTF